MESKKELQLVSFEQARKLKELGFDWDCRAFYDLRSKTRYELKNSEPTNETAKILKGCDKIAVLAPEIALVFQWLRNEHKVDVNIFNEDYLKRSYSYSIRYSEYHFFKANILGYKSYETIETEALTKALELL